MSEPNLAAARTARRARVITIDHLGVRRLLPHRASILLVDRVELYAPAERRLVAVKNVAQNDPFLEGHFPEFPIYPGVLIIEALAQTSTLLMHLESLIGENTSDDEFQAALRTFSPPYAVLAESRVKHAEPSFPGDQIRMEARCVSNANGVAGFRVRTFSATGEVGSQGRISIAVSADALVAA